MHRLHSGLTVAIAIKKGKSAELRLLLKQINAAVHRSISDEQDPGESSDRSVGQAEGLLASERLANPGNSGSSTIEELSGVSIDISGINSDNRQDVPGIAQLTSMSKTVAVNSPGIATIDILGPAMTGNIIETFKRATSSRQRPLCDFERSETTLFVSGVILPAQYYGEEILPETLVFATSYCGSLDQHLKDLMETCKDGLCKIFKHCVDFPDDDQTTDNELTRYLKRHRQSGAFNSRYNCITKQDVKNEKILKREIQDFIDSIEGPDAKIKKDPLALRKFIQEHIRSQGAKYKWADQPAKDTLTEFLTKKRALLIPVAVIISIIAITVIINPESIGWFWSFILGIAIFIDFVALIYLLTRAFREIIAHDKNPTAQRPPDDWVRKVNATQLRPILNEMTAAAPLKKGLLRRRFYHAALRVVDFGRSHLMNVPTVSSIRWLAIDNKKRLLFLSNYSNTTDFYVREFLTGGTPRGVNFMFTNGEGFPDAKRLTKGGITDDPEGYMNVIHTHQHVTDLWYAHDFHITIDQILKHRKLRNGLYKEMNKKETMQWLRLI